VSDEWVKTEIAGRHWRRFRACLRSAVFKCPGRLRGRLPRPSRGKDGGAFRGLQTLAEEVGDDPGCSGYGKVFGVAGPACEVMRIGKGGWQGKTRNQKLETRNWQPRPEI